MPTYTVISQVDHYPTGTTISPIAVIRGKTNAYGHSLHVATIDAANPDTAMTTATSQSYTAQPDSDWDNICSNQWTAIGVADNGVCPSWSVRAVVPGAHKVEGRFESMLSHRWVVDVDDPTVRTVNEATKYAYRQTADLYNDAWY
ncbi:hypothetical protein AB0B94_31240 [Micromonospora sp. NPDC048986]|uniref:hypothetical protein n=1 Tax=Micromonospora sp. NPDC048986 TaxID=3155644 RepID=UPI0033EDDDF3